jgi:hypothetical protein
MSSTDSVFQRALSNMLAEIFDGPPGQEAYLLNPGDPDLLRQLDTIEASAASKRPISGRTTTAAHVDHLHFGLSILNRWAAGEANPRAGADWSQLAALRSYRGSAANSTRRSRPRSRKVAKGCRHPHELGRHGRCRRSLHGRSHGVSLRGNQANPRGAEWVEKKTRGGLTNSWRSERNGSLWRTHVTAG